jgi:hypothetical protein
MVNLPEKTHAALMYLLQQAAQEKVSIAGFAFGSEPPCFINFGNCKDYTNIKLYERLCEGVREKVAAGKFEKQPVGRVV